MKIVALTILSFCCITAYCAGKPYRNYLLTQIQQPLHIAEITSGKLIPNAASVIPRYQIPKGAIFCRMEDKVTRATGVWLKIGVE